MSQILTSEFPLDRYTLSGADGIYDLSTEAELCEFMYRIREWQVDINVANGGVGWALNGTYTVFTRGTNSNGVQSDILLSERELVLVGLYPGELGGSILYSAFPDDLTFNLYTRFQVTTVAGVQTAWQCQCELAINATALGTAATIGSTSAATLTIRGHPVQLYDAAGTWTGSVTATPITWWASAPTSGGLPVFDTATGAQINPNVVID